jgi:Flp pilus assembly protein TadD
MRLGKWKQRALLVLIFAGFLAGGAPFVRAQEVVIKGRVVDPGGAPLPNVTVTLLDSTTGAKFSLKTKKDGSFLKLGIPTGTYQVKLELQGYVALETAIRVEFGKAEEQKFTLEKVPLKMSEDPDLAEGLKYFQAGDFTKAIEFFEKGSAKFPDSVEVNYDLGVSYLRSGRTDEAIARLRKVMALNPNLIEAYFALGECHFAKGETQNALDAFSLALEIQPGNAQVYYNLGIVYYNNGKTDEAVFSFEKAKELNPKFTSTYYQLGLALVKKGDYAKAIEAFEMFLSLEPSAPEAESIKKMIEELKKQLVGKQSNPGGTT